MQDDYDEPVASQESANVSLPNVDFKTDRLLGSKKLPSAPTSPMGSNSPSVPVSRSASEPASPIKIRPTSPSLGIGAASASQSVDDSALIMPPPLHPAPVAVSRHFQRVSRLHFLLSFLFDYLIVCILGNLPP